MRQTLYDYCRGGQREELLAEWDEAKNAPDTPRTVSYGSGRKMWWRCEKGHSWRSSVDNRRKGSGCPYCAGHLILKEASLGARFPELVSQWDGEKNAPLTPFDVAPGSHKRVWWMCDKGHSWRSAVHSRSGGTGCPVCAGSRVEAGFNDLASQYPTLAKEWDREKNGELSPEAVTPSSAKKVWWRCPLGHGYLAAIQHRVREGSGCPYCAERELLPGVNDLETKAPEVAAQWHPTFNEPLTPRQVLPGSHRQAWWLCSEGHVWKAVIYSRTGKAASGCPICAGRTGAVQFGDAMPSHHGSR